MTAVYLLFVVVIAEGVVEFLIFESAGNRLFGMIHNGSGGDVFVNLHTGAGGDKFTDDNVFFQTEQRIDFVLDCGVGKYAGGFLERCRRQEGFRRESGFRDTEQRTFCLCGFSAVFKGFLVGVFVRKDVDERAGVCDASRRERPLPA